MHVACGSVLLWWHCDMSCTSGFVDDVMFSYRGSVCQNQAQLYRQLDVSQCQCLVEFTVRMWRLRGRSPRYWLVMLTEISRELFCCSPMFYVVVTPGAVEMYLYSNWMKWLFWWLSVRFSCRLYCLIYQHSADDICHMWLLLLVIYRMLTFNVMFAEYVHTIVMAVSRYLAGWIQVLYYHYTRLFYGLMLSFISKCHCYHAVIDAWVVWSVAFVCLSVCLCSKGKGLKLSKPKSVQI